MAETTKGSADRTEDTEEWTDAERAAMKERAKEMKAARRRGATADGESDVRAKLAELEGEDRTIGERLHEIVKATAPDLTPRLWYGMPAYARDGKLICFYQPAAKFKARYATLGFEQSANLDEGAMWPTAFALKELTPETEERITQLITRATS
jgi:uncharacterized protein YdhG (YjbR/CyaY superfamily)